MWMGRRYLEQGVKLKNDVEGTEKPRRKEGVENEVDGAEKPKRRGGELCG